MCCRILMIMCVACLPTLASASSLMGYSGRLYDEQMNPLTGTVDVTFRIYNTETLGTVLFEETHEILLADGYFFALINGESANFLHEDYNAFDELFFLNDILYLSIDVDGQELDPRQRLAGAPWALGSNGNIVSGDGISVVSDGGSVTVSVESVSWNQVQGAPIGSVGTAGQWCRSDGAQIQCDQNAPTGNDIGDIGVDGEWCRSDGSAIFCDQAAPAAAVHTHSEYASKPTGTLYMDIPVYHFRSGDGTGTGDWPSDGFRLRRNPAVGRSSAVKQSVRLPDGAAVESFGCYYTTSNSALLTVQLTGLPRSSGGIDCGSSTATTAGLVSVDNACANLISNNVWTSSYYTYAARLSVADDTAQVDIYSCAVSYTLP